MFLGKRNDPESIKLMLQRVRAAFSCGVQKILLYITPSMLCQVILEHKGDMPQNPEAVLICSWTRTGEGTFERFDTDATIDNAVVVSMLEGALFDRTKVIAPDYPEVGYDDTAEEPRGFSGWPDPFLSATV